MTQLATLSANDLRMVLDTCRQIRNSGILAPGYLDRKLAKLPRISSGEGAEFKFFKLDAAVTTEVEITGLASTYSGTTSGDPVTLINWEGLLDDAPEDYLGLFVQVDDDWVFVQGLCIFPEE
jgi:hypothetical protein